jgi:hypothetical protein
MTDFPKHFTIINYGLKWRERLSDKKGEAMAKQRDWEKDLIKMFGFLPTESFGWMLFGFLIDRAKSLTGANFYITRGQTFYFDGSSVGYRIDEHGHTGACALSFLDLMERYLGDTK